MNRLRRRTPGCIVTIFVAAICGVGAPAAAAETTPPTIAITSPAEGQHFALKSTAASAYSCDDPGGSGVATCLAQGVIDTTTVGAHTFTVNATDHDGNAASKTVNYVVDPDTTPPTITIGSPGDGQHFPLGTGIATSYSCDDAGGSALATCTAATPIDYAIGTHAYTVTATDGAGNHASKSVSYAIDPDTTPPTITITSPANGQHFPLGASFPGTYGCADTGGSGLAMCAAATGIDLTVGTHVFTVNARDVAGNTATKSATYVVEPARAGTAPATSGAAFSTPRVTLPARASTTALRRGVSLTLTRLAPRSRVVLRVRRGTRTIKVIRATANAAGTARLKISLSRAQTRALRGKTLTLRFTTTAANGAHKVVTKRLKVS